MQFTAPLDVMGFRIWKSALDRRQQETLRDTVRDILRVAPLQRPVTPSGKPMSVRMTSAGRLGWIADQHGYRYSSRHPHGTAWPSIPDAILEIWACGTGLARKPDCCLVNWYDADARMGMHQDKDEGDFGWPVLSISLGDTATFRMGGPERGGKTRSIRLESGDVVLMAGEARLAYHGVDRIHSGTSTLLRDGGRINLTLRVVTSTATVA